VTLLLVVLAGAAGAGARFVVDHAIAQAVDRELPVGTLVVNTVGSFGAGVLAGWVVAHGVGEQARLVIGAGFLGAFTTFSTFAVETLRLVEEGATGPAVRNVAASLALTMTAAAVGYAIAAT
jgi:CrcB protein